MAKVRCFKCKGQKQYAGIGGIMKPCQDCGELGYVERATPVLVVPSSTEVAPTELVDACERNLQDVKAKQASEAVVAPLDVEPVVGVSTKKPIFAGYEDEVILAILDEPHMEALAWRNKYIGLDKLFAMSHITNQKECIYNHAQRADIRATYAASQAVAPRKVDLGAAQDLSVAKDPDCLKDIADQEKRIEAQKAKKKSSGGLNG